MDKQYVEMNQKELTDLLAKYSHAYYDLDSPMVDDAVYDELYDILVQMEQSSGIVYGNSPTQRVQGECVSYLKKVKHTTPMLSCAKTKDMTEVKRFFDKGDFYHCYTSMKLDGCFVAHTPIIMANGTYKPIKDIQVGDEVLSFTEQGEIVKKKVTNVFYNGRKSVDQWEHAKSIQGHRGEITATKNHKFYTPDGWKPLESTSRPYMLKYLLSQTQESFLLGALLGDGNFSKRQGSSKERVLEFFYPKKTSEDTLLYLDKISHLFSGVEAKERTYISGYGSKIMVKHLTSAPVYPRYFYNSDNYLNAGFTYTEEICSHLTPLSLAILYIDDGSLAASQQEGRNVKNLQPRATLSLYRHSLEAVQCFSNYLTSLGFSNTVQFGGKRIKSKGDGYIIQISAEGSQAFFETIAPYIPKEFEYKLGLIYRGGEKIEWWNDNGRWGLAPIEIQKYQTTCFSRQKHFDAYDIEVEDTHAYFANGYAVHNCTLCLTYDNGVLTQAVTRGNGVEGEDVTHNARFIRNLPKRISTPEHIELRGECIIKNSDFKKVKELQDFANPRNAAAGILRRLEPVRGLTDYLSFYAFDVIYPDNKFTTKVNYMQWLSMIGFETVIGKFCKTADEVEAVIADIGNNTEFPFDGAVVEYNHIEFAKSLGATAHHENRHLAFKYTDECQETIFRGVELNTGRNGIVSITGVFDPVEIDGTTVSRASLHNVDIFNSFELGEGDTITVYKANQIIPQIRENLTRSGTYHLPDRCPVCSAKLEVKKNVNTNVLFCPNPSCDSKLLQRLVLFCSKDGMNIEGLAEAQLATFIAQGWVRNFSDIYGLYWYGKEIEKLEGFGELSVMNLLDAIDHSKKTDLAHVITALGIPGVGKTSAKLIAKHFAWHYNEFVAALYNDFDFTQIDTLGPAVQSAIYEWFSVTENREWLDELIARSDPYGIMGQEFQFENPDGVISDSIFTGKTFCITGTFDFSTRPGIIAHVESLGGKSVGSVSKKTDFLLAGKDCGSKLTKARECGIRIIEEDELKEILRV